MNIKDFYNKIAKSWYNVRHWTILKEELETLNDRWSGGKVLNIGCAHGSDFIPLDFKRFQFYGIDISKNLLLLAKKYSKKFDLIFHLILSDMRFLPFKDSSFDYIVCVATLHHLLKKRERILALREIKRVLKQGGEAFISVWNRDNPELPDEEIIEREWKFGKEILKRKYYLYTKEEFEKELYEAGFEIISIYKDSENRNICALVFHT